MNLHVLLLFSGCAFTSLLAGAIVIRILRREYLPVIRRMKEED